MLGAPAAGVTIGEVAVGTDDVLADGLADVLDGEPAGEPEGLALLVAPADSVGMA